LKKEKGGNVTESDDFSAVSSEHLIEVKPKVSKKVEI
jgi:hypothetical protein